MHTIELYPIPSKISYSAKLADLSGRTGIGIDPSLSPRFRRALRRFMASLGPRIGSLKMHAGLQHVPGTELLTVGVGERSGRSGQYSLVISPDGITLEGADESGCFYGLETVRQILEQAPLNALPVLRCEDAPDFADRGFMLDISRCKVPTIETLHRYIDLLARLKVNQFQLYTEHTFAFSAHSTVWQHSSPLSADDILDLDAYCRDRYIELVPNFNSFGHFERWLRHDNYKHLAESPDGFVHPWGGRSPWGSTLKPDPATIAFLDSLYGELLPNFSSVRLNVGCDETWELGKGWSKSLCERKGVHRVYLDFLLKINGLANKHGRLMMFWGDIILHQPELIKHLPSECIALDWGYESEHPFKSECAHFAKAGVPFYVCPGTSSWNALLGRTTNCLANLENAAKNGLANGACGFLNTDWGDGGHHQYFPISLPGMFAGAALSWCYRSNRGTDPAGAIGRLALDNAGPAFGQALAGLGDVHRLLPAPARNATLMNKLLFDKTTDTATMGQTSASDIHRALERIDELCAVIVKTGKGSAQNTLAAREVCTNAQMARLGLMRGLVRCGEKIPAAKLRAMLTRLLEQHRVLWLARNQPGGLAESSARLKSVGKFLK